MNDWLYTLGYAIGAVIAAAMFGLVVVGVVAELRAQPAAVCVDPKPANLRGAKK